MSKGLFAGGKGESPLAIEAIEEIATLETLTPARSRIAGALPFAMAGAALVVGVAVFGSYMGKSASARVGPEPEWKNVSDTAVTLVSRASLGNAQVDLEPPQDAQLAPDMVNRIRNSVQFHRRR